MTKDKSDSKINSAKIIKIQESMIKKGGSNPKPSTPKPENVAPPSQKPKNSGSSNKN